MAGLQTGIPARNDGYQGIQYFRKRLNFDGSGGIQGVAAGAVSFVIPAGSIIVMPLTGIDTQTVFNAGTNNRFQIGISGTVSKYGLNVTAATLGFAAGAVAIGHRISADTTVLFTPDITGTAATTGEVECVLAFIPPN
jgi:hypothetical protein